MDLIQRIQVQGHILSIGGDGLRIAILFYFEKVDYTLENGTGPSIMIQKPLLECLPDCGRALLSHSIFFPFFGAFPIAQWKKKSQHFFTQGKGLSLSLDPSKILGSPALGLVTGTSNPRRGLKIDLTLY
jgi:hypothetical protein